MNTRPLHLRTCWFALVIAAIGGAACDAPSARPGSAPPSPAGAAPSIGEREWRCTRIGTTTPPPDCMPTLTLGADGRASGFAGVNRWSGTCTVQGAALTFGPLVATRMAGPPARMEVEQQYLRTLATVTQWSTSNGTLRLSDGSAVVAEFEPMPAPAPATKH